MRYGAYTHTGKVRKINEDYYYIPSSNDDKLDLMIIADGMGGHNAGDLASRMAVEMILSYFKKNGTSIDSVDQLKDAIYESIQLANKSVFALSITEERLAGMGTTLTMAVFYKGSVYLGHVGDSRGYFISGQRVLQLTRDHSLVQELVDNGSITEEEMASHPQRNVITRALGTEDFIKIDYYESPLGDGDIILLCTDGLVLHVDIEEFVKASLSSKVPIEKFAEELGNKALSVGGVDNITIALAQYNSKEER